MGDERYPCLGFDPARGNVAAVRDLADQLSGTGICAGEAYDVLQSVKGNKDVWTGEAAQAFAGNLDELPGFLDGARTSMQDAGKALTTWSDRLEAHQRRARELEEQARQAIAAAERADVTAAKADANAATRANEAASNAWGTVEDIRREAENLRDLWQDDSRICAEALKDAGENAPDSGLFDDICDVVSDAGEWLAENLGDIAGIVAAVAGVLAFIPVLTPFMAPLAIAAGAVALAAHGTEMVVEGKWDDANAWVELGGDVVGLVPGVRALGKGFDVASDVIAGTDKLVDVSRIGVSGMADTAGEAALRGGRAFTDEMSQPSTAAKWLVERTTGVNMADDATELVNRATNTARAIEGGTNVALQVPSVVGFGDDGPVATNAKDAAGYGSLVLGGVTGLIK